MKQSAQNPRKVRPETSCCLKTPSMSSMEQGYKETTLSNVGPVEVLAPSQQINNNNKFHSSNHHKIQHRFPKKLAVNIQFTDIYFSTTVWSLQHPKPFKKEILHGISGEFKAGELTAIMGPSGAGKSTLLNILAGYRERGVEGTVTVNGKDRRKEPRDKFGRLSCYIMQDDALRPDLTVREAMTFSAHFKLGYLSSYKQKQKQIFDLLEMLGLEEHSNTRTGSLSGGQKKRLSVALELISNPPVLFLDEPTTGLDSSSTSQCVSLLKLLAQQGRTVVCTIHQPSALLFEMFDHLYAVADGHCIYEGSVKKLVPFLSDLGLRCPSYHNPADYLLEVAVGEYGADIHVMAAASAKNVTERRSMPESTKDIYAISDSDIEIDKPPPQYASLASSEDSSIDEIPDSTPVQNSLFLQFFILFYRNLIILFRNYTYLCIRIGIHILIALLFGYLYRSVGVKADSVFANYVYLYGTILFLVYTGKMAVTLSIPLEMNTLRREYFNHWYALVPSFLAIILVEIPIQLLSSVSYIVISYILTEQPWEEQRIALFFMVCLTVTLTAQAAGFFIGVMTPFKIAVFLSPSIAVILSTFGFNAFHHDIPDYFMWVYHISYFRAAFHSLVVSIYGNNRTILPCDAIYCHYKFPEKFLWDMDIREVDISENTIYVSSLCLLLHICTAAAIWVKLNRR